MFELTSRAAAALAQDRARIGQGDALAIRISASESGNGSGAGFQLRWASHPWPDDVVMESNGTRVFLSPELAESLNGTVLDAEDTDRGPRLILKHRST